MAHSTVLPDVPADDADDYSTDTSASDADSATDQHALRVFLSQAKGDCMRIYVAAGRPQMEVRVCGCRKLSCSRTLPAPHKGSVSDPTTHAVDGWFLICQPTRRGSPYQDGLLSSFRSDDDQRAHLQRLSDQNLEDAHALEANSPENSRNFHDENDGLGETPRRSTHSPAMGSVAFATETNEDPPLALRDMASWPTPRSGGGPGRFKTPPPPGERQAARDTSAAPMTAEVETLTQLLTESLAQQRIFAEQVIQVMSTQVAAAAGAVTPDGDEDVTSDDETSQDSRQGARPKKKKKRGKGKSKSKGKRKGKGKGQKPEGKKPSLWFGVVAGTTGSLHRSEAEARTRSHEFEPRGRMSTAFSTKKAAQMWIAANLDDPHSSDTASDTTDNSSSDDEPPAVPHRARAMSNVVPPPVWAPVTAGSPFTFITRDRSEGTKDEIFGIGMKKETCSRPWLLEDLQ
jgi:hypothetical protein